MLLRQCCLHIILIIKSWSTLLKQIIYRFVINLTEKLECTVENFVNFGNACRSTVRYIPIPAVLHALIRDETIIKLIFCSSFVSSLKNTQLHLVIFKMHFTEHGNSQHQYRLLQCSACTGPGFMLQRIDPALSPSTVCQMLNLRQ